jgi:hypothetical protein
MQQQEMQQREHELMPGDAAVVEAVSFGARMREQHEAQQHKQERQERQEMQLQETQHSGSTISRYSLRRCTPRHSSSVKRYCSS